MNEFYDGTKLLSMKDINGNTPEIYLCDTNRSGGKTTWFSKYFVNRFKKYGEKFMLIYRFNYELDNVSDKFFKDIKDLFFNDDNMSSKKRASGIYHELFLNDVSCGYAVSLNNADQIKKNSHLFSDTIRILFDEYQSETNHYCDRETTKLISIHTSVARGQGEQVRYVPVIMLSNAVSLLNPYYTALGISSRLRDNTKFLKGDGFVLEKGFIETASRKQKSSGFNRAFKEDDYVRYSSENVYLNDNTAFIERPKIKGRYICTIKFGGKDFAIREFADDGFLYCDDSPDNTFPIKIVISSDDHNVNYVMLKKNDLFLSQLRYYFEKGCFRFKDLRCKDAILKSLSYR